MPSPFKAGLVDATARRLALASSAPPPNSSDKTIAAAIAFTAPDSFGWAKGATLNLGALLNIDSGGQYNYYAGLTLPTPITALKVGASFDLVSVNNTIGGGVNPNNDSG